MRASLAVVAADGPAHIDALAEKTGRTAHELAGVLLNLEMRELVTRLPGSCFVRKLQRLLTAGPPGRERAYSSR